MKPDGTPRAERTEEVLALHGEELLVERRTVPTATVRIATVTGSRDRLVEEELFDERVEIERIPVGRYVDAVPPPRQEGALTILPVVEEVVVVERRLLLREEVHVRRVRTARRHVETVSLRLQDAVVTRIPIDPAAAAASTPTPTPTGTQPRTRQDTRTMTDETIVAVYDTPAHAEAAIRDLEAAGVPRDAISTQGGAPAMSTAAPRERGFWSSLFGGEPAHDTAVYDRSVESGSSVVTVRSPASHVGAVCEILDRHGPIDIDDRAQGYGLGANATAPAAGLASGAAATPAATMPAGPRGLAADAGTVYGGGDQVVSLSEEQLAVGKRLVDRGTTRVRRFVVETPVEQDVSLHSERVTIERRPVSGQTVATAPEFSDRVIEMTETDEEAVVGKSAHVVEEVVIRKDATDRVETVRDTLRREDVEITQDRGAASDPLARPRI